MTTTGLPPRFALAATTPQVVALLPDLGRVLVGLSGGGATHERIGVIEQSAIDKGMIRLSGAAHSASLEAAAVACIVADRIGGMRGRVFPRLEFRDAENVLLLSITGMDGLEAFDAALSPWVGAAEEAPPRPSPTGTADLPEDDPGAILMEALRASGGEVEIALGGGAARQSWRGVIEETKPAMGFANIIHPDFHLHWRGGSLGPLQARGEAWEALDPSGAPTGLVFRPMDDAARTALTARA